jgi:DNA-binding response OmpR family regulator
MTSIEGAQSPRVLVVDDDPDLLRAIGDALHDEGLNVETAGNGLEALGIARACKPDLVVLDVMLPVVGSAHVATRLRQLLSETIPLLVITADGRAADKARQLGAYAYLRKPFELAQLLAEVRRGLGATGAYAR